MIKHNSDLFKMLFGSPLDEAQLATFAAHINSKNLDISELFFTAVINKQFAAARTIIENGYDINSDENIPWQIFLDTVYHASRFCIDFYINNGLSITRTLINDLNEIIAQNTDNFLCKGVKLLIAEWEDRLSESENIH